MTTERKARGLLDILRGNARYTDAAERDVRAIVGFILAIEAAAVAAVLRPEPAPLDGLDATMDRLRLATAADWIDPEDIDRIADKYDSLPPTPDHLRAALRAEGETP